MQLKAHQLTAHLQQQLLPVYLVSGDEPLQVQECADQIRAAARAAGCSEREVIDVGPKFNWDDIIASAASMSLFAERKLVELRLPSGKPGAEGSKALCEYLDMSAGSEDVLLVVSGKIDKQSTSSKWYKALDAAGATLQVWQVKEHELPRWLEQRLAAAGLAIEPEALELLCQRVEGNLLAAVQEVEKLKLVAGDGSITAAEVAGAVANSARYDMFTLVDKALAGRAADSLRMLHGLRGEGTEPVVIVWALVRELRTLASARRAVDGGQSPQQALRQLRVWSSREALVAAALKRHSAASVVKLLELALAADGCVKGLSRDDPWDQLEALLLAVAGKPLAA